MPVSDHGLTYGIFAVHKTMVLQADGQEIPIYLALLRTVPAGLLLNRVKICTSGNSFKSSGMKMR